MKFTEHEEERRETGNPRAFGQDNNVALPSILLVASVAVLLKGVKVGEKCIFKALTECLA